MIFDYLHRQYAVVDQDHKVLFYVKKWYSCFMGDSEYHGNAIPLYSGTYIYATNECLNKMKSKLGQLSRKTYVDSFTQNY